MKVSSIHNCCQQCCEAIKGAIRSVEGATSDTAEPGERAFEVKGNFDAASLFRSLNAAGFHAKVSA